MGVAIREFDPAKDNTPEWASLLYKLAGDQPRLRAYYSGPFRDYGRVFVAEVEGRVAGTVGFCVQKDLCDDTFLGVIVGLAHSADGVGAALVKHCMTEARKHGCLKVHVGATPEMAGYLEAMGVGLTRTAVSLEAYLDNVALPKTGD
jgi:N-acetylglutamate synthase-like GNAT family acetyltransferase